MKLPAFLIAGRFALRESRSAFKNFKIFIASLFLGTAIIAGVGSLTANIADSIHQDGKIFLGGDVEIRQIQKRLNDQEREFLSTMGRISEVATLRTMAHTDKDSALVDLKAVDASYPLYGSLDLRQGSYEPNQLAQEAGKWGIMVSSALALKLNLQVGSDLKLGISHYQLRGIIKKEPDANNQGLQLAPGAIISLDSLFENELVQPGSLVRYHNRIRLSEGLSPKIFKEKLQTAYPGHGWRVRDSSSGGSGIRRFVDRLGQFISLVGLTALLVGGVGVSNGVRSYLDSKTNVIATYKILGATGQTILLTYLGQILLIASLAILAGLVTGAVIPLMAGELLKDMLPVALNMKLYVKPVILAAYYSFSIALIFTLWPLGRAANIPAARLFRQKISNRRGFKQSFAYMLIIALLAVLLVATVIYVSDFRPITVGMLVGAGMAFLILLACSAICKKIAKSLPRSKSPLLRIALSNIHRPGNSTSPIILSLGLGLILFTAIALIENNLLREINDRVKGDAPSFFFLDIQKDQRDSFISYFKHREGVESYRTVPNLRGRVTHVRSVKADKVDVKPEGRWILRGDRGVTFTPDLPPDNKIIAGKWWDANYAGPTEVSISRQMADSMDLVVGDEITVNILSRDFTATIASIRDFNWESFGINYVMMFDPNSLKAAPFTYVATAKVRPEVEDQIYQELSRKFPGISNIRMKEILASALEMLGKIAGAIDVMAAITIMSGVLVLAGAIAAGHKARIYDAAVLKIVGATRSDILKAYIIEFILLGFLTGAIAILLGSLAAYAVITQMMEMSWQLPFVIPFGTVTVSILVTLAFGMVSIWLALSARPAQILRNH